MVQTQPATPSINLVPLDGSISDHTCGVDLHAGIEGPERQVGLSYRTGCSFQESVRREKALLVPGIEGLLGLSPCQLEVQKPGQLQAQADVCKQVSGTVNRRRSSAICSRKGNVYQSGNLTVPIALRRLSTRMRSRSRMQGA